MLRREQHASQAWSVERTMGAERSRGAESRRFRTSRAARVRPTSALSASAASCWQRSHGSPTAAARARYRCIASSCAYSSCTSTAADTKEVGAPERTRKQAGDDAVCEYLTKHLNHLKQR